MFELKYQITDGDILAENKKIAMFYFCLFFIVAAKDDIRFGPNYLCFFWAVDGDSAFYAYRAEKSCK